MPRNNEQIVHKYFTALEENEWKCKCGRKLLQKKGTGWTNLKNRFFSVAGYAYNDLRKSLLPINLEMQLFLKVNHRFWNESTVDSLDSDI